MIVSELQTVPVFPLPLVQLFPHALMPLHIFEPRYRDLLRDCLAGERRMLIATFEAGAESNAHPALRPLCGLGEVIAHEGLSDGRSNILLRGVSRCRIVDEVADDRRYRTARIELIAESLTNTARISAAHSSLIVLADRLSQLLPSGGSTLRTLLESQAEAGPLSDVLSAALVTDPETRQDLLETADVAVRVERLTAEVAALVATIRADRGVMN